MSRSRRKRLGLEWSARNCARTANRRGHISRARRRALLQNVRSEEWALQIFAQGEGQPSRSAADVDERIVGSQPERAQRAALEDANLPILPADDPFHRTFAAVRFNQPGEMLLIGED